MRRLLSHLFLNPVFPLLSFLILIQGCSRPFLQTYPADDRESVEVLEAFSEFQQRSDLLCNCCLDAEADIVISVSGWFHDQTAKLSGYLQAMKPGYVRFIALNPLGQPWYILVTDGETFKSLNIFAEKAYEGSVRSRTYNKIAPAGFKPGFSYYWLTGALPPGDDQVRAVMHDRTQKDAYWLQIMPAAGNSESMILFDPVKLQVRRHVLRNDKGEYLADVTYADYQALAAPKQKEVRQNAAPDVSMSEGAGDYCRIPGRMTIGSPQGSESMDIRLHSFIAEAHFLPADFTLEIPENFEQLRVR